MNITANDTAVLIFSRSAASEAEKKGYARMAGKKGGCQLAAHLIQQTVSEAAHSGLPVITHFEPQQVGVCFSERLANAIEQSFSAGYAKLIIVGTDCPTLCANQLYAAAVQLQSKSLVLGPSPDGGIYLLGISKEAYCRQHFLALPWLSAALYRSWKEYASFMQLTIAVEMSAVDLDDANGLQQWLNATPTHFLHLLFTELLIRWRQNIFPVLSKSFFNYFIPAAFFLRGPPTAI